MTGFNILIGSCCTTYNSLQKPQIFNKRKTSQNCWINPKIYRIYVKNDNLFLYFTEYDNS